jgi:hypothetical protein
MYLVFSMFISRPTSIPASIKVSMFFVIVSLLSPSRHHQHRPQADISHSTSIPPGFPGPS